MKFGTEGYYEESVIKYKKKYAQFRCQVSESILQKVLTSNGCSMEDLKNLLKTNSKDLENLVFCIYSKLVNGRANWSSVMYSSIIAELLELTGNFDYELHIGMILPVKVRSIDNYSKSLVANYMYIRTDSGVSFHNFNGVLEDTDFSYIRDDIVEV